MEDPSQPFTLVLERLYSRFTRRILRKTKAECFQGMELMENLPLYEMARKILRATKLNPKTYKQRDMERPINIDSQMEEKVPQFFLRNIPRVEKPTIEEEYGFEVVRTRSPEDENIVATLLKIRYEPPKLIERFNIDEIKWFRALIKRVVYQNQWNKFFCRELKEHIQGPLYKYKPDEGEEQ